MASRKAGSLKRTDTVIVTSVNLTADVTGVLPVANGGTGSGSYTDGQLLIGNTTGNTLAKGTLTGTANQVIVTNAGGSITLSTPQDIGTSSSVQHGRMSVGRSQLTYVIEAYTSGSTSFMNIETGNAGSNGSLRMANPNRAWVMGVRGDLSNDFAFADSTAGAIRFMLSAGAARVRFFQTSDDGVNAFQLTGGMAITGTMAKYNGVNTAGIGTPAVYGQGRFTAQTAAKATVATYTVGASDGSFIVSANVLVTTATWHNFTVTCAYTDESNTARTLTLNFSTIGGVIAKAIANAGGAVPYHGLPLHIRAKASTAITIATTGTFTAVTYNVEGLITQAA